jgi:hypothetical protein
MLYFSHQLQTKHKLIPRNHTMASFTQQNKKIALLFIWPVICDYTVTYWHLVIR